MTEENLHAAIAKLKSQDRSETTVLDEAPDPTFKILARPSKPNPPRTEAALVGPGTELKLLLKKLHIVPRGCKCNERAQQMDEWGPEGCETRIGTIVEWLGEEAKKRYLPFSKIAAAILVKRAIRNARKKLEVLAR